MPRSEPCPVQLVSARPLHLRMSQNCLGSGMGEISPRKDMCKQTMGIYRWVLAKQGRIEVHSWMLAGRLRLHRQGMSTCFVKFPFQPCSLFRVYRACVPGSIGQHRCRPASQHLHSGRPKHSISNSMDAAGTAPFFLPCALTSADCRNRGALPVGYLTERGDALPSRVGHSTTRRARKVTIGDAHKISALSGICRPHPHSRCNSTKSNRPTRIIWRSEMNSSKPCL